MIFKRKNKINKTPGNAPSHAGYNFLLHIKNNTWEGVLVNENEIIEKIPPQYSVKNQTTKNNQSSIVFESVNNYVKSSSVRNYQAHCLLL